MKLETVIIVRPFMIEDYENVVALWQDSELPYRPHGRDSRRRIEKEIEHDRCLFLVAEHQSKIVGSIIATHDGRKGWLNRLAVAKDYRRHNIARKLVAAAEKHLEDLGIDVIACLIESGNKISQQFFTQSGYRPHSGITYFSRRKSARS